MAQYVKGDVVLTPFPFSDDEDFKVRPALVLAVLPYGSGLDYLVCIITTQPAPDPHLLPLTNTYIDGGRLSEKTRQSLREMARQSGEPMQTAASALKGDQRGRNSRGEHLLRRCLVWGLRPDGGA